MYVKTPKYMADINQHQLLYTFILLSARNLTLHAIAFPLFFLSLAVIFVHLQVTPLLLIRSFTIGKVISQTGSQLSLNFL